MLYRSRSRADRAEAERDEAIESLSSQKEFLKKRYNSAYQEISKLWGENAKLLGHQNPKQKIRIVERMSAENRKLKTVVDNLFITFIVCRSNYNRRILLIR